MPMKAPSDFLIRAKGKSAPSARFAAISASHLRPSASVYGCGTRLRFLATRKLPISGTKAEISAVSGGRSRSRVVSRTRFMALPDEAKQKGRWRTISLAYSMGRHLAACLFSRLFRCFRHRDDRNIGTALQSLPVLDLASNFGEQGVVLSHCDIAASMNFGAALPHQDIPGKDEFSAVTLDAQTLTVGIAAVTR